MGIQGKTDPVSLLGNLLSTQQLECSFSPLLPTKQTTMNKRLSRASRAYMYPTSLSKLISCHLPPTPQLLTAFHLYHLFFFSVLLTPSQGVYACCNHLSSFATALAPTLVFLSSISFRLAASSAQIAFPDNSI